MRRLIFTSIVILNAFAIIGVSREALSQRTLSELGPFPGPYDGLELRLEAVKDTFLIGEPILAEVTLINASDRPISDPCLFLPGFYPFSVFSVESETTLTWLSATMAGTMLFRDLVLPPGGCVETAVLAGALGVLSEGSRGPALFITQCCTIPGTYAFMARYHHVAERDSSGRVLEEGAVVSGLDSFYVKEPTEWDRIVYERMGPDLLTAGGWDPETRRPYPDKVIKARVETLRDLYLMDSTSAYAPYIWARYAKAQYGFGLGIEKDGDKAIEVMSHLTRRFPGHRLSEEVEFDIADYYCGRGRNSESRSLSEILLTKYPRNVRAYGRCREDRAQLQSLEGCEVEGRCEGDP